MLTNQSVELPNHFNPEASQLTQESSSLESHRVSTSTGLRGRDFLNGNDTSDHKFSARSKPDLENNLATRIEAGELVPSLTPNIDIGSPLRKVQIDGDKARDSPLKDLN